VLAPGQGGLEKPVATGYYVDFTELARMYGWERISSHDEPDFDWRTNFTALEYWHFQKTDGLNWYDAMREIYAPADLEYNFDWNKARNSGLTELRLYIKHVPPPPSAWKWFMLLPVDSRQ
jgi:TolB protein